MHTYTSAYILEYIYHYRCSSPPRNG
jgi:hypothetical protein